MAIFFLLGIWTMRVIYRSSIRSAEQQARDVIENAREKASNITRGAELEAKEEYYRAKEEFEGRLAEREAELERLVQQRERLETKLETKIEAHEARLLELDRRERDLVGRIAEADASRARLEEDRARIVHRLEEIAGMTADEARANLLTELDAELRHESALLVRRAEGETRELAAKKARQVLTLAIQKCAAEVVTEVTVSLVPLASDDMKGRIIGREGRNIRALELRTGVNFIVDDTPEAVVLSCFDPLRREVARIALERLLADGRIHPARIEETVAKVEQEMAEQIKEAGQRAFFDLGILDAHPDVMDMLGRLKFRTSYGQNTLAHSIEVAHLCGALAAELRADVATARRAGLLHDLGKAMTSEIEGSHALVGAEFCRRLGESSAVVHAIAAHHNEEDPKTIVAVLLQTADAVSASRPGARRESLESYVKRLSHLETLAETFPGVEKAYALQAGRELRVIVEPTALDDAGCTLLARDISKRVSSELQFPGQIRITVLREFRAVDFAR